MYGDKFTLLIGYSAQ